MILHGSMPVNDTAQQLIWKIHGLGVFLSTANPLRLLHSGLVAYSHASSVSRLEN